MEQEADSLSFSTSFNNICRLCLNQGKLEILHNLKCDLTAKILNFLEIFLEYNLPASICEQCLNDVTQMANFIKKCKHSQNLLRQIEEECEKLKPNTDIKIEILDNADLECDTDNDEANELQIENDNENVALPCSYSIIPWENTNQKYSNTEKMCDKCGQKVTKIKEHYKMSRNCRPTFACSLCNISFTVERNLRSHVSALHGDNKLPRFMCHVCSKMFKYKTSLKRHLHIHEFHKRFVCEVCGKGYTTKTHLVNHLSLHTDQKPFVCPFCDETFSMQSEWLVHQKGHEVAMIKEPIVEKIVTESATPPQNVACGVCNKLFTNERALNLHKRSHNDNLTFKCNICEEEFKSRLSLRSHSQTHRAEKRFSCLCCEKRFKLRSYLTTHMRAHTGERPFACTLCFKTFTQRAHLTYHMLTHNGKKSFECTFCGKTFFLKGNLTVHMRLHTGERPYQCHVCDQGFRDSSIRKRHVIAKHGEEQVKYIGSVASSASNEI